mmetsp:Transcript_24490/g.56164  ORF Transcript_24490/g.56164 Transcript_24490/m.56164 type:complete len:456 (+) Transcript_24490:565-1932(+)
MYLCPMVARSRLEPNANCFCRSHFLMAEKDSVHCSTQNTVSNRYLVCPAFHASPMSSTKVDLSTEIGGLSFPSVLYNASGPRSGTVEALKRVAASPDTGAVLSKSATVVSQTGNPQPRVHHDENEMASYNSEGLPNQGIDYYLAEDNIDEIMKSNEKKPYIVSLSGKTLSDNIEMLQRIVKLKPTARSKIAGIELNLACPNIVGKPTLAYDMDQLNDVLARVAKEMEKHYKPSSSTKMPVFGVKLPPYLDMIQLESVANIINKYEGSLISYITAINTFGNSLPIDVTVEQPFISANSGLAGMSGRATHATACANVWKFRKSLKPSIDIVGVGGVETGDDVIRLVLAGAKAVQVGTRHWKEGPACFERIAKETREWLSQHGYTSISQVYNQLKPWSKERANQARMLRKEAKQNQAANGESSDQVQSNEASLWKLISAILLVIVAILCADKGLLPSE